MSVTNTDQGNAAVNSRQWPRNARSCQPMRSCTTGVTPSPMFTSGVTCTEASMPQPQATESGTASPRSAQRERP